MQYESKVTAGRAVRPIMHTPRSGARETSLLKFAALALVWGLCCVCLSCGGTDAGPSYTTTPPPPPSPPPYGGGTSNFEESYYGTCGGGHPPDYIIVKPSESYRQYLASKEYKDFEKRLDAWEARFGTATEVRKQMEELKNLGRGIAITQNPNLDLMLWIRGAPYHGQVKVPNTDLSELASGLLNPLAGPQKFNHIYQTLSLALETGSVPPPAPQQLLAGLENFWRNAWRANQGFERDPSGRVLLAAVFRALNEEALLTKRLNELTQKADADSTAKLELTPTLNGVKRELTEVHIKVEMLRQEMDKRVNFLQCIVELLRLAPNGEFEAFMKDLDQPALQAAAGHILCEAGLLSAPLVWTGLVQDVDWLAAHPGDGAIPEPGSERARRVMAVDAAWAVLTDPNVDGLGAVCEFFKESPAVSLAIYRKAFELIERLGMKVLKPEVLEIFPKLLALIKDPAVDPALRERARTSLLRLLAARDGKASMEETIAVLAPVLKDPDPDLVKAIEVFLVAHTGQNLGRDPEAWKKLYDKMRANQNGKPDHTTTQAPIKLDGPTK